MKQSHPHANKIRSILDAIEKGHVIQYRDDDGWLEDSATDAVIFLSSEGCDPSHIRTQELFGPRP